MSTKHYKLKIIKGRGLGKKIGVPTINFDPNAVKDVKTGIYVCRVDFGKSANWGVLHFGPRSTFDDKNLSLEVYLFDFDPESKIPRLLDLEVFDYIRPVRKFETVESMVKEIDSDVRIAKKIISNYRDC